ncbi:hypothetical protein [Microvirga guangxiensis]|uniref:Uncharacterized protein n=1 Tax=Microvirga guangxiensis TaxID=549386 RepID=A0A1G5F5L5_9HYPH|nr:hypothetical protein [Microvirga guangxiensis]SCY34190.1 hypothetical protein SAMN02927923_01217 [Microvirga guangxiensis]
MATFRMGPVEIQVTEDMTAGDIQTLQQAFDELKISYPDVDDRGLAQGVFFNWFPGCSKDDLIAAASVMLGHHS